jgi:hypothetical protein
MVSIHVRRMLTVYVNKCYGYIMNRETGLDRTTLKLILKKYSVKAYTGLSWLRIGSNGGLCEHCNESSIKGR